MIRPICSILFLAVAFAHSVATADEPASGSPQTETLSRSKVADASQSQQWAKLKELLAQDLDVNASQVDGMTALHWAVRWQNFDATQALINHGADVSATNDYGIPPLFLAAAYGYPRITSLLLKAGADVDTKVAGEETVLMHAARNGNVPTIRALLQHDPEVDASNRHRQTALMWAASAGHADAVDVLLAAGADTEAKTKSAFTAWFFAARDGRGEVLERFLARGQDVNDTLNPVNSSGRAPRKGMSALMLAVESGHFDVALNLVRSGADPNDLRSGFGPLHATSWVRRPGRGDNVEGDPPPRVDGKVSSLEFVREMVSAGADVNLRLTRGGSQKARLTKKGATPMLFAAFTNDLPLMRLLKELGGDPTIANDVGTTPMLAAAGVGVFVADEFPGSEPETIAAIDQLHAWGCSVGDIDQNGETTVHGAAYRSFPKVVTHLVKLGADPHHWYRENKMQSTPRQVAQGKRPGSFKPNLATITAIDQALFNAGIEPIPWTRPLDRKSWDDAGPADQ